MTEAGSQKSWRSWFLALRPKTLTAALAPILVATALVHADGYPVLWWASICALLSAMFIQIGTNLFNDAIDFKKGADTVHRIGPGSAYAPEHDRHTIRVISPLRLVCVFNPALTGRETHDADGSYLPAE